MIRINLLKPRRTPIPSQTSRKSSKKTSLKWLNVVWAAVCLVLAAMAARLVSSLLGDIKWETIGWATLLIVVVALVVWLYRNSESLRSAGTAATRSKWLLSLLSLVMLLVAAVVGYGAYRYFHSQPGGTIPTTADTTFTVVAGEEPTELIRVPLGSGLRWASTQRDAKFEVISDSGEKAGFPAGSYQQLSDGRWVRFRSLEAGPVTIEVRVVPLR
mgnify:FL=1